MSELDLDLLCAQAMERIRKLINRLAGQAVRRMKEIWKETTP